MRLLIVAGFYLGFFACSPGTKNISINSTTVGNDPTLALCRKPPDLGVRFVGRVDGCDSRGVRFAWSGTGFVGKFKGTGVRVHLFDTQNQYSVVIDGSPMPTLKTTAGDNTYPLASGLTDSEHAFEMYRRTEASFGVTIVMSIEIDKNDAGDARLLTPPAAPSRRLEVIGDSISCGYGDEGVMPCSFSADTENHTLSYGSVLARTLGAELSTVAWSGKGIYNNYNGDRSEPMPTLYDLTVPDDKQHPWTFSWQPDAVIINLGTNDYCSSHDPTDDQFVSTYETFLEHIRSKYSSAFILCTMGPMLFGTDLAMVRKNITAVVAARVKSGDTNVKYFELTTPNTNPGCDYHPSVATQAAMAAELATELKVDLGW